MTNMKKGIYYLDIYNSPAPLRPESYNYPNHGRNQFESRNFFLYDPVESSWLNLSNLMKYAISNF